MKYSIYLTECQGVWIVSKNKKGFNKMLKPFYIVAGVTRLELAASCVTSKRSNQLNYTPGCHFLVGDAGLEPATSTL